MQQPNEARVLLTEQTKVCGMSISSSILQWLKESNPRLSMKTTHKGNLNVMTQTKDESKGILRQKIGKNLTHHPSCRIKYRRLVNIQNHAHSSADTQSSPGFFVLPPLQYDIEKEEKNAGLMQNSMSKKYLGTAQVLDCEQSLIFLFKSGQIESTRDGQAVRNEAKNWLRK